MSSLLSPGEPHPNPKFLFSAEARERIRQLPSTTPVPLFHPRTLGGLSPSDSVTSSVYSASTLPLDAASHHLLASHLHRPQPRSPHDAAAWDASLQQAHSSRALHTFGGQAYQLPPSGYPHPPSAYDGVQYLPTPVPSRPESTPRSAPFFASLAKHAPLAVHPSHPTSLTPSPYPRHSVSVYAEYDKAWMRTPLPKSVANHPMAIAHAEASRRREEWEREQAEAERRQREDWERQQADQAAAATPTTEATPATSAKKGSAAKLGRRPALPSHRAPSAVFSSPASADSAAFRTPQPRAKQRPLAPQSSSQKRRIAPMRVEGDEGQKNEGSSEGTIKGAELLPSKRSSPSASRSPAPERIEVDDEQTADDEEEADPPASPSPDDELTADDAPDTADDSWDDDAEVDVESPRLPATLSPVKQRLSNRIYLAPAAAPTPSAEAAPTALKPDLTLTRWFLHLRPSSGSAPTPALLLKGLTPDKEPWITGYVTQRLNPTTLLTKTRRYHLAGALDEDEMRLEGWEERGLRAFTAGLPSDWEARVQHELERRAQEAFEYGAEEDEEAGKEDAKESAATTSSRPHRSPAPLKAWKSSQWTEAETLRLVEAQLLHEGKDGKALWPLVAAEVGNDRTGEECRRKFEEVKREQQATILSTQRHLLAAPPAPERAFAQRRDVEPKPKAQKPIPSKPTAQRSPSPFPPPTRKAPKQSTPAPKPKPASKTPRTKATPVRRAATARRRGGVAEVGALLPSVTNPHDVALGVSRRSGRAVIAPLKWWETEREVNGVVLKGAQVDVRQYQQALSAKEQRERERKEDTGRWSRDGRAELFLAYRDVDPTEPRFWEEVAARIPGRSADECQREFQAMYPTPKRRKRQAASKAADEGKEDTEEGSEGDEGQPQPRKRMRVTTRKRELRQALERRDEEHSGDDLFDSTPYKGNADVAAPPAHQRKRLPAPSGEEKGEERKDEEDEVLVGDAALADAVVQRLVTERRKTRTNLSRARDEESRRRGVEVDKKKHADRFAETAQDVEAQLKALDREMEEEGHDRPMEEDVDDDDGDE